MSFLNNMINEFTHQGGQAPHGGQSNYGQGGYGQQQHQQSRYPTQSGYGGGPPGPPPQVPPPWIAEWV